MTESQTLLKEEEAILLATINDFVSWLKSKNIIQEASIIKSTYLLPYADEDWVMKVDTKKDQVSFNTYIRKKCSFDYYKIVILHEFFHLAVQKVPNKQDATKIKDDFGAELMKLIDIEADFYVALYLKEKLNYTLVKYWAINYEGGKVFIDHWVRVIKFERFIGSLLSISKMFINSSNKEDSVISYDLYLPTISPIYTEDSLHVLVIKKEHIYFEEIEASYLDFVKLKECYKDVTQHSIIGYVNELIKFSCKALKLNISKEIEAELEFLKS